MDEFDLVSSPSFAHPGLDAPPLNPDLYSRCLSFPPALRWAECLSPQKAHLEALTPSVMVLGDGTFGR